MSYQFTVSPDFSPDYLSGWFIFNTWLQRALGRSFHLEMMDNFQQLHQAIDEDRIDLIYANPYDASMLVRDKGFVPLVKPRGGADEAVIAVRADSDVDAVESLFPGIKVASTDDPDVHLMGMIMLEPAGLSHDSMEIKQCDNYVLVAKALLKGECETGIFLDKAFDELSRPIQSQLRALVRSEIQVIHHSLMAGPRLQAEVGNLRRVLSTMEIDPKGQGVLEGLGVSGWDLVDEEETEFMIDLMETLTYSPD